MGSNLPEVLATFSSVGDEISVRLRSWPISNALPTWKDHVEAHAAKHGWGVTKDTYTVTLWIRENPSLLAAVRASNMAGAEFKIESLANGSATETHRAMLKSRGEMAKLLELFAPMLPCIQLVRI